MGNLLPKQNKTIVAGFVYNESNSRSADVHEPVSFDLTLKFSPMINVPFQDNSLVWLYQHS